MKIIDCTTYYSEDLMLDVRLNILDKYVDKFIIVESNFSHSGQKKSLNFDINNFKKFKDKINYLVIENEPKGIKVNSQNSSSIKRMNSLLRIEQSYDYMLNALGEFDDNDLICLSDNDEIPNFESKSFKNFSNNIVIFKQLFFYYKFNLYYDLVPWFGTKACKKKNLKSMSWLRNIKNKKYPFWRLDTYFSDLKLTNVDIIQDGGWHFTNIKTPEQIFEKLQNYGHHNEFEDSGLTFEELEKIVKNRIVNYNHFSDKTKGYRQNYEYKLKIVDNKFLPKYLIDNKDKYKEWFDTN